MKKRIVSIMLPLVLGASTLMAAGNTTAPAFNPFEEMQKMQQEMDRIFNEFHQKFLQDAQFGHFMDTFTSRPAVDLKDAGGYARRRRKKHQDRGQRRDAEHLRRFDTRKEREG